MGTWGTGIFDDDVALDVRNEYVDAIANGESDAAVTKRMIKAWAGTGVRGDDEAPVFWLALAATQWRYGRLRRDVKAGALAVVRAGDARFDGAPGEARRRRALDALAKKLRSPQPKRTTPRRRATPVVTSTSVYSPNGTASAGAFAIGYLAQVAVEMESNGTAGGGGVFAAECTATDLGLRWLDDDTLEITYPAGARVHKRDADTFFYGRTIKITYRKRR